jgi:hypothetical protein
MPDMADSKLFQQFFEAFHALAPPESHGFENSEDVLLGSHLAKYRWFLRQVTQPQASAKVHW